MKSKINLQFVTEIYELLEYLCLYMRKEEGKIGEIMRKVVKESPCLDAREKLRKVGSVILEKREVLLMKQSNEHCPYQ